MVVSKVKASKYERPYSILVTNKRKIEIFNLTKLRVSKTRDLTNTRCATKKDQKVQKSKVCNQKPAQHFKIIFIDYYSLKPENIVKTFYHDNFFFFCKTNF